MGSCAPSRALALAIVVAAALAPTDAIADRAIAGTVVDARTGKPLAGAVILVGDSEATSDDDGGFRVPLDGRERVDVTVVADGYAPYFSTVRAGSKLTIRLVAEAGGSELIRLHARAPDAPPLELDTDEIRTQPGAGNDVLRALQSLPGVARTPFGLGGLALRGTAPRDTRVYLDGMEVPLLYHFGGIASFVPTGAVADVSLEPGGAGPRYGRGLGGVALVTSRAGRRDRWRASGEVSLIHAAALGEGPGPLEGSWLVGFRRSYFDGILAASGLELAVVPRYLDAQLRWESGDHRWLAIAVGSDDLLSLLPDGAMVGGLDATNVQSFDYRARFLRLGVRYRASRGRTTLSIMPSFGVDKLDAAAVHKGIDKGMHRTTLPIWLRAELTTPLAGGTFAIGVDGGWQHHSYDLLNTPPPTLMDPDPTDV
ncbi:MAG TPA: carboxypeptidase regulatory-like domain-containing protein, partial [Kofleriaceae bacterium]|nr:carboxypeptidase regulatory-like domain-containing protein [Kofleriaceae bacterium]